jgi:hypothetical protein
MTDSVFVGAALNESLPILDPISLTIVKLWIIVVDPRIKNGNSQWSIVSLILVIIFFNIKFQYLKQLNEVIEPPITAALPKSLSAFLLPDFQLWEY